MGGQTFDYKHPYLVSLSPYTFAGKDTNGNGANEVGLADLSMLKKGVAGIGPIEVDIKPCENETKPCEKPCKITEGNVLLDNSNDNWHFGVPEVYGDLYFAAQYNVTDAAGVTGHYGRHIILHELGHTLGLTHFNHSYSAMNKGLRPWSNRAEEKRMEFLPDDREAFREKLYPRPGHTEEDVAALMSWYNSPKIPKRQNRICVPSMGNSFSPSWDDNVCGIDAAGFGSRSVCPGDKIYTRYGIVNYGTMSMTMDEELWFSKNDWLFAGAPQG